MEFDRTVVSNFTVEHDTTIGGVRAFKVARVTSVKAAGSGTPQGTPVSMESSSTSNGKFYVSTKGAFLGATSIDDVDLRTEDPGAGRRDQPEAKRANADRADSVILIG